MTITVLNTAYINGDTFYAADINATNTVVNTLSASQSLIAAKGDILTGISDDTFTKTTVGANNTVLYANSAATGGVSWGTVTSAMITDGTITGTDIASTTITASNIANATITSTQCLGTGGSTSLVSISTDSLPSATSAKIHFKTTAGAPTTGGAIGDIWFVTA